MLFRELFKDRIFGNANNWLDQNLGPITSAVASSALWLVWMTAFGGCLLLVWWLTKRSMDTPTTTATSPQVTSAVEPRSARPSTTYEGAHHELLLFVVDHLLPACEAQFVLQATLISLGSKNEALQIMANSQIGAPLHGYDVLAGLHTSPPRYIDFDEMIAAVDEAEKSYQAFCYQSYRLEKGVCHILSDPPGQGLHEQWRVRHNKLLEAYNAIKKDSRFKQLFRPSNSRPARWGPPLQKGQTLPPPDGVFPDD